MFRSAIASLLLTQALSAAVNKTGLIDACEYATSEAASAAWVAGDGSTPATVRVVDGKPALVMACKFAGTQLGRGVWDRKLDLDLSQAQGVEVELMCTNAGPISAFSLYLQSGRGWYHGTFSPRYAEGWNRITLTKAEMKEDDKPESWNHLTKLRIAAWRGDDADTEFLIRNVHTIGVLGADAHVLILEGGHGDDVQESERKSAPEYAERISKLLSAEGIRHATTHDDDFTLEYSNAPRSSCCRITQASRKPAPKSWPTI